MERVNFIIKESYGSHEVLCCPKCNEQFEIDAYSEENMIFDREYHGLVAKCPACGVIQIGEEDVY